MGFFKRLGWLLTGRPSEKQQAVGSTVVSRDLAAGGYQKSELVFGCIQEIITSTSEAPLRVYGRDDEELPNHGFRQPVRRPNPVMSEFDLWELSLLHLYLAGNVFWEKVRSNGGRVVELWPPRSNRMRIAPSREDFVAGYIYEIDGRRFPLDADDVIHFKLPGPLDDFWGMPPPESEQVDENPPGQPRVALK